MNHPFLRSAAFGVLALAATLALGTACGPTEEPEPIVTEQPRGTFTYQPPPDTPEQIVEPIVELRYEGGLIKNPDPTPFVRVYPGGRVLIHYPAYMKKAGDYELQLSQEEIDELLSSFADRQVLTVENTALETMAASVRTQQGPAEPIDDHGVKTVVQINANFQPGDTPDSGLMEVNRSLEATGLPSPEVIDVVADPGLRRLKDFSSGVAELEALARRSDLEAVDLKDSGSGRN